jgi:hypothetical protein
MKNFTQQTQTLLGFRRGLWALFIAGLIPVIFFSSFQPWTWGIMDDPGMVMAARELHTTIPIKKKLAILFPIEGVSSGMFKPLWYVYVRGRLAILESASGQHTVQMLLVLSVLLAWWRLSLLFGVEATMIPLGLLMTLYFGPFTIAGIGFLSIQELPGLALFSWALYFAKFSQTTSRDGPLIPLIICVVAACLMKETFFCLIPPVLLCLYSQNSSMGQKVSAICLMVLFIGFPIFLWTHVKTGYSAGYRMDIHHLVSQTGLSLEHLAWTYKFGTPLLLLGFTAKVTQREFRLFDLVCLAGTGLYFAVLVPWTADIGYYQGPIAPFLGFLTAGCAYALFSLRNPFIRRTSKVFTIGLALLMIFSITKQSYKTHSFNKGLSDVQLYLIDHLKDEQVFVNGEEAAGTIPQGMQLISHKSFKNFRYVTDAALIKSPAYIVVYNSSRYISPLVPKNASTVLSHDGWNVFYYP